MAQHVSAVKVEIRANMETVERQNGSKGERGKKEIENKKERLLACVTSRPFLANQPPTALSAFRGLTGV